MATFSPCCQLLPTTFSAVARSTRRESTEIEGVLPRPTPHAEASSRQNPARIIAAERDLLITDIQPEYHTLSIAQFRKSGIWLGSLVQYLVVLRNAPEPVTPVACNPFPSSPRLRDDASLFLQVTAQADEYSSATCYCFRRRRWTYVPGASIDVDRDAC